MQLDLGGIAKGFAADEAAAVLSKRGIRSALVAAGGDIAATDAPPDHAGWRVAVASLDDAGTPAGYVTLANAAVSTSGDAEQVLVAGGVRYSHIFDPRTGRALTGHRSVTVVARNAMTSDALATAVSVLGAERGLRLVEETPGAAASISEDAAGARRTIESPHWRAITSGEK
jgi:thiamine biosynthesis lipoprotein